MILLGSLVGVRIIFFRPSLNSSFIRIIWFLPAFRTKCLSSISLWFGSYVYQRWDGGWNEKLGPKGLKDEVIFISAERGAFRNFRFKAILFRVLMIFFILWIVFYCCSL
jgi:hypothetical protein